MTVGLPGPSRARHPLLDDPELAYLHRELLVHEETAAALDRRAAAAAEPGAARLRRRAARHRWLAGRIRGYLAEAVPRVAAVEPGESRT
ncbi:MULTISPECIES: hypothetical protein [unclassified Blastococcus]